MTAEPADSRPTNPFYEFFRSEAAGGALLVVCACAALAVANSRWAAAYDHVLATTIAIDGAGHVLSLSVRQWINDALMAVFFLLVGLEIKREALVGELASPRQAALPIIGAVGGMLVPALIYVVASGAGVEVRGWAIPMATDIAFALGALSVVAPRAPGGLKVFLAALAIVDDMGALLVIALFYTTAIAWAALAKAAVFVVALAALNVSGVRRLTPYLVLGLALWYFVHESGVHATIAGVVLAFAIPTRTRINATEFSAKARRLLDHFDRTETGDRLVLTSTGQQEAIIGLERASEGVTPPLLRLEHALQGFSAFVVMPLFALSNAGVSLNGSSGGKVMLAVMLGLTIGKPLGITGAAMAAVRLRLAELRRASLGPRYMDARGSAASDLRCRSSLPHLRSRGRTCSTQRRSGFWAARFSPASSARSCCAAELAEGEPRIPFVPPCPNQGLADHGHTRRRQSSRRS